MADDGWISAILFNIGVEFALFLIIDNLIKSPLKDAANDAEKRTVWLCESALLALSCFILYIFHHTPYLLLLFASITVVYTQLVGQIGISDLLAGIQAQWENHRQHEESMRQMERHKLQQQAMNISHVSSSELSSVPGQTVDHSYGASFPFLNKQPSLQYPPNATVVPGQDMPAYSLNANAHVYSTAQRQNQNTYIMYGQNWNNVVNSSGSVTGIQSRDHPGYTATSTADPHLGGPPKTVWSKQLLRRSLHPNIEEKAPSKPLMYSFKSKVMNVVGFGSSVQHPLGLVNNGQNICFINSVMQCLARAPVLRESLTEIMSKNLECGASEYELLSSLAELLNTLNLPPKESRSSASVARFSKACSVLNPTLVKPPGEQMLQQDAAEFLQWLLETLHQILNRAQPNVESGSSNFSVGNRQSNAKLYRLKHIYGDLSMHRILEVKAQCKREIDIANCLNGESYAEAIQMLSDMEWLIHKQKNDTVIDSLFTGQLVEASCDMNNGRISVNLQTFNVLPVPIGDSFSGLVKLNDCFTSFCKTENMDEPLSSFALPDARNDQVAEARFRNINSGQLGATPVTRQNFRLAQNSDMPCVPSPIHPSMVPANSAVMSDCLPSQTPFSSPIQPFMRDTMMSDSGFLDNTFRTSTPLGSQAAFSHQQIEIRRRCLLRQLPECLIIQLMRFSFDPTLGPRKVKTAVGIRLHGFDLKDTIYDSVVERSDMTTPDSNHVYDLYGLCIHLGGNSTSHGHYVSYCLDQDKWYRMDDEDVREVNMSYQLNTEEVRQNAYILFYKRTSAVNV